MAAISDDAEFLKALSELSGNYLGEEAKGLHETLQLTSQVEDSFKALFRPEAVLQEEDAALQNPSVTQPSEVEFWGISLNSVTMTATLPSRRKESIKNLLSLKSLCKHCKQTHIRIRSDNTTAIFCIDRCGSTKFNLNALTEQIFAWAQLRGITLSAEFIKVFDNVEADAESRIRNIDIEWVLTPFVFNSLCTLLYTPEIDLFASRINAQLPSYISWKPDPYAKYSNTFTIDWSNMYSYAFPHFSIIGRTLKRILEDKATSLAILLLWPTQVWFPMAFELLTAPPVLLPCASLVLPHGLSRVLSQAPKLILTAMILSGDPSKTKAFRRKLLNFCFSRGDQTLNHSMGLLSKDGCHFVSAGKFVLFSHM
ncbi:hypothetical protein Pcinc_024571 [Petrolisthes cinctipes]|uniref:Reverse transcriptase RNase H-like domain-containing protein n=1 Tax=Petrolisthes cinctipes TaxID=88211 RepID=A0AAE1FB05_PETCI|nr:hypothetical protein Pcinc_024571 [Petrolisthes cinctipes]